MFVECPHCRTRVRPKGDGTCPSCQSNVHERLQPSETSLTHFEDHSAGTDGEDHPREYLMLLADEGQLRNRVHSEVFSSFFTACRTSVDEVFEDPRNQQPRDILVACAIFPDGQKFYEIQADPELPEPLIRAIRVAMDELETPPVENGPVPFAYCITINDGCETPPAFQYPFASTFAGRTGSLDALLMEEAGLPFTPDPSTPGPRYVADDVPGSWWGRLTSRLLGRRRHLRDGAARRAPQKPEPPPAATQTEDLTPGMLHVPEGRYSEEEISKLIDEAPRTAQLYEMRAALRCAGGQFEAGIADYTKALELEPQNVEARVARAGAYCHADNTSQALMDYSEALSLDARSHAARCGRASIYFELGAWDAAIADLDVAIEVDPRSPNLHVLRAKSHWRAGNLDAASDDLNRAVERDPHHAEARALRGFVRCAMNRDEQDMDLALDDLSRAIRLNPDVPHTYAHRAQVHLMNQEFELAIADCDRAVELDANCGIAYAIRGLARQELGEAAESIEDCSKAIQLDVSASEVYIGRALAHADQGDADTALVDIEAILETEPDNIDALSLRGNLRIQLGEPEVGMEDFDRLVSFHPDTSDAYVRRGNAYRVIGQHEDALHDLDTAVSLQPQNVGALFSRAICHRECHNHKAALDDLDQAIRLQPDNPLTYFERAQVYLAEDNDERALRDLDEVVRLAPEFVPAHYVRAGLYAKLDRLDEAAEEYGKLIRLAPSLGSAYTGRAGVWIQKGEHDKADADYRKAIESDPDAAEEYLLQHLVVEASCLHQNESFAAAIDKANEALAINPDYPPALHALAAAYWYSEQLVEAAEIYEKLAEYTEDAFEVLSSLGQVRAEMGEFEEALQTLDRALEAGQGSVSRKALAYAYSGRALALVGLEKYDEAELDFQRAVKDCPENAWVYYNQALFYYKLRKTRAATHCFELALALEHPKLTPRKRDRARAFLEQMT